MGLGDCEDTPFNGQFLYDLRVGLEAEEQAELKDWIEETLYIIRCGKGEDIESQERIDENALAQALHANPSNDSLLQKKWAFIRTGLADRLNGEGGHDLQRLIEELLFAIACERKIQGKRPYTKAAVIMLCFEIVYGDFLWRQELRKDGVTSYFRSHLIQAAINHVKQGFTSLPSILTALKHDDYEDLPLHRQDCWKKKREEATLTLNHNAQPKPDWLFCDGLYQHFLNPTELVFLGSVESSTATTIEGLTTPLMAAEVGPEEGDKDTVKTMHYVAALRTSVYAAITKVLEQVHNAETIQGLPEDRQETKLRTILLLHGLMAEVLEFDLARRRIIGAGIDYYAPELRQWYQKLQRERLSRTLGLLDPRDPGATILPSFLVAKEGGERLSSEIPPLYPLLQSLILHGEGQRIIEEHYLPADPRIVSIELRPIPLEDWVDVGTFSEEKRSYKPEIPPGDPLFEIVVLTTEENIDTELALELGRRLQFAEISGYLDSRKIAGGRARRGTQTYWNIPRVGRIRVRINSVREEALLKRGIHADGENKGAPKWLLNRLDLLEHELKYNFDGTPSLDLVRRILLRSSINVYIEPTDTVGRYTLPRNSTVLDLVAALLPEERALELLGFATKVDRLVDGRRERAPFLNTLIPGATYTVSDTLSPTPLLELSEVLSFGSHVRTFERARTLWDRLACADLNPQDPSCAEKIRRAQIARGRAHLLKLGDLLGIEEGSNVEEGQKPFGFLLYVALKPLLPEGDISEENIFQALATIGDARFDPLRSFSRYLKRGPCHITLELEDRPRVLSQVLETFPKEVNLSQIDTSHNQAGSEPYAIARMTVNPDPSIRPYDLMRLLLKITHLTPPVRGVFLAEESFDFPDNLESEIPPICRDFVL